MDLAVGKGAVDRHAKDSAEDRERNQDDRPSGPRAGILGRIAVRSDEETGDDRLAGRADVDGSVDDADGLGCVLDAREVTRGRSRQDAVNADHARADHHERDARDPGSVRGRVIHDRDRDRAHAQNHQDEVDERHGAAARLEVAIRDAAGRVGAQETAQAHDHAPVRAHEEAAIEAHGLGEVRIVLDDSVANGAGAELDEDDRPQHAMLRIGEQLLDHLPESEASMGHVLIVCVEVLEADVAWFVAQPDHHRDPEGQREEGGEEEDPPVLIDTRVAGAKQ